MGVDIDGGDFAVGRFDLHSKFLPFSATLTIFMISEDLHVTLYNLPNGAIFVSALNEVSIRSFT